MLLDHEYQPKFKSFDYLRINERILEGYDILRDLLGAYVRGTKGNRTKGSGKMGKKNDKVESSGAERRMVQKVCCKN